MVRTRAGATREDLFSALDSAAAEKGGFNGVDASLLDCEVDREVADKLLSFCAGLPCPADGVGIALRLAHTDLGSGTDCEQRLFDCLAEREATERQLKLQEQAKRDSSKEKDFSAAAGKRRKAEEGISVATARLEQLSDEIADVNRRKTETQWYALFTQMERSPRWSIGSLDLTNCGLHATGIVLLTQVLLDLEHRAEGGAVSELILDGNDLGDIAMTALTSYLRLSSSVRFLRLRNVAITDRGVSQILSALVSNKTLRLLDLRSNGLASLEISKAALVGVQRFNKCAEVLLE